MKKMILALLLLAVFVVSACSTYEPIEVEPIVDETVAPIEVELPPPQEFTTIMPRLVIRTFEEAIVYATDVMVVQYVGRRPFGQRLTEFEFIVSESILGVANAGDTVFAYTEDLSTITFGCCHDLMRHTVFTPGTDYLLPFNRWVLPYLNAPEDMLRFLYTIVIDLDNPLNSTMYNEPLYLNSSGLNFNERSFTRQEIISYVTDLSRNNPPARGMHIRSDVTEDIILGSPYVLVVEINELHRPSRGDSDWMSTDLFYATVLDVLERSGDISVGDVIDVTFFANTVSTGEQHIIAVTGSRTGWFNFTSRYSLFSLDYLDEIIEILAPPPAESVTVTAAGGATTVQAGETLQFTAIVAPEDALQSVIWEVSGHEGAAISITGLLTVDESVPADTILTVTATATDTEISDSINVTVTVTPGNENGGGGSGSGWWRDPHVPATPQQQLPLPPVEDNEDIDPQVRLQLIFTAGQVEFLFHGIPRTAVGAPFLDPATDRMMVPLRTVAESTGVEVRWDYDTRSAVIYLPDETLVIPVDQPLPDGMGSAMLVNDRTFVPLRFVMEAFGADAQWYEPNLQAIISFY